MKKTLKISKALPSLSDGYGWEITPAFDNEAWNYTLYLVNLLTNKRLSGRYFDRITPKIVKNAASQLLKSDEKLYNLAKTTNFKDNSYFGFYVNHESLQQALASTKVSQGVLESHKGV